MYDVCDLNRIGVIDYPVHNDEWQRRNWQFPCAIDAAFSPSFGENSERARSFVDCPRGTVGGDGILKADEFNNLPEILCGTRRPTNLHT